MSETSPNLILPYVQPAQAQKHVTVNEALRRLDALVQLAVLSRAVADPPTSPADGERYIVPASATGDWAGASEGDVAAYQDGAWAFYPPQEGWRADVADDGAGLVFRAGAWRYEAESANGASARIAVIEVDHEIAAGATSDTVAIVPDRATVFAVSGLVLTAVTGAASFDVGVAGAAARYATAVGVAAGTVFVGPSAQPEAYYGATAIRLTANGGSFTGGVVRFAVHALICEAPGA